MVRVGIRELRQSASELLRRVRSGETIEITDRGHPVALLTPILHGSVLERLRAAGQTEVATEDIQDLPRPITLPQGVELPSDALERLRRDER